MENIKDQKCPKCGDPFLLNEIRCSTCNFEPQSPKDRWRSENLGKQRTKPIANRTGKSRFK